MNITELLSKNPVVPLVQTDDPDVAVKTSRALAAGGLKVAEVVFRTDRALECLQAVADNVPEMIAGAGTVLSAGQANAALDHGAKFIVSPGLDNGVVGVAREHGVPVYPGNLADFLAIPAVLACGGSWLTPADKIAAGDYDAITKLAAEAVAIARKARGLDK